MSPVALFGGIGPGEILLIMLVALLVYGRRLPEVARGIGRGWAELRRGVNDLQHGLERDLEALPPPQPLDVTVTKPSDEVAKAPPPAGAPGPPNAEEEKEAAPPPPAG